MDHPVYSYHLPLAIKLKFEIWILFYSSFRFYNNISRPVKGYKKGIVAQRFFNMIYECVAWLIYKRLTTKYWASQTTVWNLFNLLFLNSMFSTFVHLFLCLKITENSGLIKGVFAKKWKGVQIINGDCYTNLTSICCVYKEKIVKNDSYRRTLASIQIQESCNIRFGS